MATSKIARNFPTGAAVTNADSIYWYRYGDIACVIAVPKSRSIAVNTLFYGIPKPKQPFEFTDSIGKKWYIGIADGQGAIKNENGIENYMSFCITYVCIAT